MCLVKAILQYNSLLFRNIIIYVVLIQMQHLVSPSYSNFGSACSEHKVVNELINKLSSSKLGSP